MGFDIEPNWAGKFSFLIRFLFSGKRLRPTRVAGLAAVLACGWGWCGAASPLAAQEGAPQDALARAASWQPLSFAELRQDFDQWMDRLEIDPLDREKAGLLLSDQALESSPELLDQLARAMQAIDPQLAPLVSGLLVDDLEAVLANRALIEGVFEPRAGASLRLMVARSLVLHQMHDEGLGELEQIQPNQVWDPATYHFYRALAEHRLLAKDKCLKSLDRLFENEAALPDRYRMVGKLMQQDIARLEQDSLDEVARLMSDINRRISLYRSGKRVIGQEEQVLEKLDKIIEELEKQQQQQQSSSTNPSSPMQDSQIAGGKGDGQAQSKGYGDGGEWGDLPPAQRAEAMAEMAKDLPPHYRQVIEEYFRKLAEEKK